MDKTVEECLSIVTMYGNLIPLSSSKPGTSASTCISNNVCSSSPALLSGDKPSSSSTLSVTSLFKSTLPDVIGTSL